jgi:hypothetical protein
MNGIIYKAGIVSARAFVRTYTGALTEDHLREGNMSALLLEELDAEDAKEMDTTLKEFETVVQEVMNALPASAKSEWESALKPIASGFTDTSAKTGTLYDEKADGKARAKLASDLTKKIQDVAGEFSALITCLEQVKAQLQKYKPEDPTQKIGDLAKAAGEGGDEAADFPTVEDITKAVEKTYKVPDWFNSAWEKGTKAAEAEGGGFFSKVVGFISALFSGDKTGNLVEGSLIAEAIMASSFEEFVAINMSTAQQKLVGSVEQVGEETGEAAAGAAAAQAGKEQAKSGKVDMKAAEQGAAALQKSPDTAKSVFDAASKVLGTADAGALKAGLAGKLADLAARQQSIVAQILALYTSGPDGATPEQVADVADAAEEQADAEVGKAFKNLDALADLGDTHLGDGGGELVKTMFSDDEAAKLFAAHRLPVGGKLHENSLSSLLFEAEEEEMVEIEDVTDLFKTIGKATGQAPDTKAIMAWATDVNDQELLDKKINVPTEGGDADEEAPVDDETAAEEQETAQAELEAAAQEAAAEAEAPSVAIANALDSWAAGLSKTSQSSLTAKKRMTGLKDLVNVALDGASKAVEKEVAKAIQKWRGEHEETLIKSKRFAKKNFDTLSDLIPQIASAMLKMTSENNTRLTRGMIRKSVYNYLDKKFQADRVIAESARWEVLAGIRRN